MKALESSQVVNGKAAADLCDSIEDDRERAFVRFMMGRAWVAVSAEGVLPPSIPIDALYFVRVCRSAYSMRNTIQEILTGNVQNVLWGE